MLENREISNAELDRDSNRLAYAMRGASARPSDHVALVLDKSPEAVVAMLACLKGGSAYPAIDAASPRVPGLVGEAAADHAGTI